MKGPTDHKVIIGYLLEWLERYFENRKVMDRSISSITTDDTILTLEKKDGTKKVYHIIPSLKDADISQYVQAQHTIVTVNTSENLSVVVSDWKGLSNVRHFSIMFVNPFSRMEKKWVVFPATHHMISEGKGIKKGLQTLFETVEPITLEKFQMIIQSEQ